MAMSAHVHPSYVVYIIRGSHPFALFSGSSNLQWLTAKIAK